MPMSPAKVECAENIILDARSSSDESSEEEEESKICSACGRELDADAAFCPKCGAEWEEPVEKKPGCCRRCCLCCACSFLLVAALVVVLILNFNTFVRMAIEAVGSALLGVNVGCGSFNLALPRGRVSISNLTVASPAGFEGHLFSLGRFVFDVRTGPLVSAVMGMQSSPIELEELKIYNLGVSLDQTSPTDSNAKAVMQHMNSVIAALTPPSSGADEVVEEKPAKPVDSTEVASLILRVLTTKVRVGRIEFANISAAACIHPLCDAAGPGTFELREILVTDVGKRPGGACLYELIAIMVQTVLMALIQSAPDQIRLNLLRALHSVLGDSFDYGALHFDAGEGLVEASKWAAWATAESAALPLRIAAKEAEIGMKTAKFGARANWEATKFGAKANWEATKFGAKANLEAAKVGAKLAFLPATLGLKLAQHVAR